MLGRSARNVRSCRTSRGPACRRAVAACDNLYRVQEAAVRDRCEVAGWPEFRMGANRVRVELADGRTFENVMFAGDRVVGVLGQDEIPFEASEVVAAIDLGRPTAAWLLSTCALTCREERV